MDKQAVLKAIEPKSDQLNADDLIAGPIDVTIKEVRGGSAEQPIALVIDGGHKPYKPSKGMTRVIVKVLGADPRAWVGHCLRLYNDPSVKWAGVAVGGIRISHMSGIDKAVELMLTVSRSKREAYRIEPLEKKVNNIGDRIGKAIKAMQGAEDSATVNRFWKSISVDLLPHATAEQKQELFVLAISKTTDIKQIPIFTDQAIEQGCDEDEISRIANERYFDLKELEGGE